jgi:zinc transport system permease protein
MTSMEHATMIEFFEALVDHAFMQRALLAGLLASIVCGVIGSFVVSRRISFLAGGVSHSLLAGMGLARYLAVVHGVVWATPVLGAVVTSILASILVGWVSMRAREREDAVIGAIWAVGMAVGILFISQTPGYSEDLMSYLFGNILMVSSSDLWLIGALDLFILLIVWLYYNKFVAVCFDEQYARLRGVRVSFFYLLLLALVGLTVVMLVEVVGIILVIALMTIPAAIAGRFTGRLPSMMLVASLLSAAFTTFGLALSFQPDLPAGATIILLAGLSYLGVTLFAKKRR